MTLHLLVWGELLDGEEANELDVELSVIPFHHSSLRTIQVLDQADDRSLRDDALSKTVVLSQRHFRSDFHVIILSVRVNPSPNRYPVGRGVVPISYCLTRWRRASGRASTLIVTFGLISSILLSISA